MAAISNKRQAAAAVLIGAIVVLQVFVQISHAETTDGAEEVSGRLISIIPAPRPDEPILTSMRRTSNKAPRRNLTCLNKYGPMCGDCNTLWTCVGDAKPAIRQNCEETSPGFPLCENNACVKNVSSQSSCATQTQCTGQGYFPNPTNCKEYYFCAGPGQSSLIYTCPYHYAYNASSTRCYRTYYSDSHDCPQIDCKKYANRYVAYTYSPLYVFCLQRKGEITPIMMRCPGNDHEFDQTEQRCKFKCRREGRFADYTDPLAYYECLYDGRDLVAVQHQRCLPGFVFEPLRQQCKSDPNADRHLQTFDEGKNGAKAKPIAPGARLNARSLASSSEED